MSKNSNLHRILPAFLLLAGLLLANLPVRAQPARHPLSEIRKVAVLGEGALSWMRSWLVGLWRPDLAKEGPSIDPDGKPNPQATDEGVTIDPKR